MTAGLPHLRKEPHAPDDLVFCAKLLEVGGHTCNISPARVTCKRRVQIQPQLTGGLWFILLLIFFFTAADILSQRYPSDNFSWNAS